jgi:hypothetical protein
MAGLGESLIGLGFALAVPAILLNTFLWMRFTRLYQLRSSEKMPFLLVDIGGRWRRALSERQADPNVEGVRRQLRVSQVLLFAPMATVLIGALLATGTR